MSLQLPDRRTAYIRSSSKPAQIVVLAADGQEAGRYTYATLAGAHAALLAWVTRDYRGEPKGWHRHDPSRRCRPAGVADAEYIGE